MLCDHLYMCIVYIYRSMLKATVVLLPLFGTTWIIGLLAVNKHTTAFAYIFTFLNVFQVQMGFTNICMKLKLLYDLI